MSHIYKITNLVNGKFYIGSSKNVKKRWSNHVYELTRNKHNNIHLQRAWNKHGKENFIFEIIKEVSDEKQFDEEQAILDDLKPFGEIGYNILTQTDCNIKYGKINKVCEKCTNPDRPRFGNVMEYCEFVCLWNMDIEIAKNNFNWNKSNYEDIGMSNMSNWTVDDYLAYEWDERMSK